MCDVPRSEYVELEAKFEQAQQLCDKLADDIKELKQYVVELESFIHSEGYTIGHCLIANKVGLFFQRGFK